MKDTVLTPKDREDLRSLGRETADTLRENGTLPGRLAALRIRRDAQILERLCEGDLLHTAGDNEWLRDNLYLIRRDGEGAYRSLRGARRLRNAREGWLLQRLTDVLVQARAADVGRDVLEAYLTGVQQVLPLTEQELALLCEAVQGSLLHYLAQERKHAAAVFTSLRQLREMGFVPLQERLSRLDELFRQDPAGVYPRMDQASRASYRRRCGELARRSGMTEAEAGEWVLSLAAEDGEHIGEYLYRKPFGEARPASPLLPYLLLQLLLPVLLAAALCVALGAFWPLPLLLLPLHEGVRLCFDRIYTRLKRPERLPRLDYGQGIPPESRTLAVSVVLLHRPEDARAAAEKLERFRLANRRAGPELLLGLLMDYGESKTAAAPGDLDIRAAAEAEIQALNSRYGGGFCLLLRPRSYSRRDRIWRGSERKRGAILELCDLLRGSESGPEAVGIPRETLRGVRYLLVLDGDTMLNMDAAAELAGTLAHPLQAPVLDEKGKRLRGFGILQPRIAVSLQAAERSPFSRLFAGQGGLDPYGGVNSDVYQDLFGTGCYNGKGILDVETFSRTLSGRFPAERLLSHDLLEGAYCGCAYVSDVALTDGFPASALSYYERQHRWVRGDWQTLPWLLPWVRSGQGTWERNPIPALGRYQIFDNLCRSLTPAAVWLTLLLCALWGGRMLGICTAVVLLCQCLRVLPAGFSWGRRYRGRVLPHTGRELGQVSWLLLLLPYTGWVQLSAALTALYRMLVSHRDLLRWVTSAESERSGDRPGRYLARMWPCLASGLACLMLGTPPGKALGILWLLTPLLSAGLSRPVSARPPLSRQERLTLLKYCRDCWRYFDELVTAERNWLPPDNVQELPERMTAERTSPTNIGLALLSILAASDLGFLPEQEAWARIERSITTVEKLPKYRGNLLNWYDIRTLKPLEPPYVSTVDSGNLLACLITLHGAAVTAAPALAPRLAALADGMELGFLYDRERELFHIGWDAATQTPTPSWYDLLESEARIAGYLAIARGEVGKKHWRHLGRTLADNGGMSGLASWTGTMFEYFLPTLFLPEPSGSLLGESLEFCCHVQRRHRLRGVWGVSESAFAEQDAGLSYAYKAHGVQALALNGGMERERVIAPYASFLALELAPRAALRNLKALQGLGMEGRYGYYDALDLTPGRAGADGTVVRCFMVHHLGMSLLAALNCLQDGVLRKRFLRDPAAAAAQELLEERTPVGVRIRTTRPAPQPQRPRRRQLPGVLLRREGVSLGEPLVWPLSNGSYTLLQSDLGCSRMTVGEILLAVCSSDRLAEVQGVGCFVWTEGRLLPLQSAPDHGGEYRRSAVCDGGSMTLYTAGEGLELRQQILVPDRGSGEVRRIRIHNLLPQKRQLTLALYLEPVLCRESAYAAHPAFQRLGLESRMLEGALVFSRRPGGSEAAVSLALTCSQPFAADTDKALLLGRGGIRSLPLAMEQPGSGVRAAAEPCAFLRTVVELQPGETKTVAFALGVGSTAEAAAVAASALLGERGSGQRLRDALLRYAPPGGVEQAARLSAALLYGPRPRMADKGALWRFGISGDLPVVACLRAEGERLLRSWALLHNLGQPFDLAIRTEDAGVYGSPETTALRRFAASLGIARWEGSRGGFHFCAAASDEWEALSLAAVAGQEPTGPAEPVTRIGREFYLRGQNRELRAVTWEPDGVSVVTRGGVGLRAWCSILSNGSMGWLCGDSGCGSLWLGNAREARLTPWRNDPLALTDVEQLFLLRDGRALSLFAAPDGCDTAVFFGFGFVRWRRTLPGGTTAELTGFIPPRRDQRILLLRLEGLQPGDRVRHLLQQGAVPFALSAPGAVVLDSGADALRLLTEERVSGGSDARWVEYRAQPELCLCCSAEQTPAPGFREGERLLQETRECWREITDAVALHSPSAPLDRYLNGWAVYQILACRILGRCSLYQSGGAFGFRDQLQDVCALIDPFPELARAQILLSAAHQYVEGDVMHWWHPHSTGDRGVRTRCSDDLLWLPYAVTRYVERTGDQSLWEAEAPFLCSPPLQPEERDRYEAAAAEGSGTVREHCRRALRLFLQRGVGVHGLAKIGSGDWNDGFDRVEGESVWLTWFGAMVLARSEAALPGCRDAASALGRAANESWADGQFLRGWYADGSPLGAAENRECALDSLSQSFAVLSGFGDPVRSREAVKKAAGLLLDVQNELVRLFAPPFDGGEEPGYIRAYLPGVRENGGQYTHGAVWLAAACLRCGETELGWQLLETLLPSRREEPVYQLEPFVLAADVYANRDMAGRGGWSWYTGAAGWYLRTVAEELLGVRVRHGELTVEPRLPQAWSGYWLHYRVGNGMYEIRVERKGEEYEVCVQKSEKSLEKLAIIPRPVI